MKLVLSSTRACESKRELVSSRSHVYMTCLGCLGASDLVALQTAKSGNFTFPQKKPGTGVDFPPGSSPSTSTSTSTTSYGGASATATATSSSPASPGVPEVDVEQPASTKSSQKKRSSVGTAFGVILLLTVVGALAAFGYKCASFSHSPPAITFTLPLPFHVCKCPSDVMEHL
jgi:cobalamin biosynthesis Mg chelatase CobN